MSQASAKIARPATARKAQATAVSRAGGTQAARQVVTFESAEALCPDVGQAATIARMFGLDDVDEAGIREAAEEGLGKLGAALRPHLNDRALAIALQRMVGAYVGSAFGAGGAGYLRLCFARKREDLEEAVARIARALEIGRG